VEGQRRASFEVRTSLNIKKENYKSQNHFLVVRSVRRLIVIANVLSSPILVSLMMEALSSSTKSVLTSATRRSIP
jgi:hypothetical protein